MKNVLKWAGIVLGGLVGVLALALGGVYALTEVQTRQRYDIPPEALAVDVRHDAATIERGRHLVADVLACSECHGEKLAGGVFVDDPLLGRAVAANLTSGRGGVGGQFSDEDFARAIRHGVKPDGTSMFVMPVDDYVNLNREDLGAVVAYLRSLPPVDNELPPNRYGPLGRVLNATGKASLLSAAKVDHNTPFADVVPAGPTAEYGQYLARTSGCTGCHGANLSGGPIPGGPPGMAVPLNLTPGGALAGYSDADVMRIIRDGVRPNGSKLASDMPYKYYHGMSDVEVTALVRYLRTLPARPFGGR